MWNAAEKVERGDMAVAERFRRLGRIRLDEDRVALRQVDDEEMDLLLDAADDGKRFAKIRLSMAGRMRERNEHLLHLEPAWVHVIAHRCVPLVSDPSFADIAVRCPSAS